MLYRRRLEMEMEELKPDLTILRSAATELRDSQRFKKLLQTVLAIGNTLNASTFRGGATGFSLDSLLKVSFALLSLLAMLQLTPSSYDLVTRYQVSKRFSGYSNSAALPRSRDSPKRFRLDRIPR